MGLFDFLKDEKINDKFIITINREYGSGGSEIARIASEKLSIPLYDEKIVELKAMESGFSEELLKGETLMPMDTVYDLYRENDSYSSEDMLSNDAAFLSQSRAIRHLAEEGSCIFLEKCAGYVLRDYKNVLKIFIHAPYDYRRKRAVEVYKDKETVVDSRITKYDTRRRNFFNKNTKLSWENAMEYDFSINASIFSQEEIAEIIADIARIKFQ